MSTPQHPSPQAAAPVWQGAAGPSYAAGPGGLSGYTSPIPVVRTHLGHAIASEWTKIRSVRSTMWTLGVFVLLVVGIGMMVALIVDANASEGDLSGENPLSFGFFGVLLGSMPIITLGVLTTASEYGTGMIRTTMVACPSRGRVLAAKGIVFFTIAFVVTLVSTGFVAMVDASLFTGAREPSGSEWLKATVGVSFYIALLGLLSLAVGSVIRHSAGAITIMIGLLLAPLVIAIFMFSESLDNVRQALFEYSIPSQLGVWYSASLSDSGPSGWDPLWIALGVTAAAFAAAFALLEKRDV
ncbi:ABC transporter permease [Streptomyces sp. NPDC001388]|uniref:ABC transporter permease n=1 Tax=unclassified Streptomyces TaxID=2593676 RepID=UPI0036A13858